MEYYKIHNKQFNHILYDIEKFYYSDFYELRCKGILSPLELDLILGTTSYLRDDTVFKMYSDDSNSNGVSNKNTMIALNVNLDPLTHIHIENVIMHEFGHRQYNQPEFKPVIEYNGLIIFNPLPIIDLSEKDYKYFTDKNEIRQRIIPLVKEMYDNKLKVVDIYNKYSKIEDIFEIYSKLDILYWLENVI